MSSIAGSLGYALGNVLHPRMLWLMVWPLVLALGFWGTLAIVFWAQIALTIAQWLQAGLAYAPFVGQWDLTDATLLVARVGHVTRAAARRARETIDRIPGAHVAGVVANDVTKSELGGDGYGYGYGYGDSRGGA